MMNAQVKYKASNKALEDLIRMMTRLEHEDRTEEGGMPEGEMRDRTLDGMSEALEPDESADDDKKSSENPEDKEFEDEKREYMKRSGKTKPSGSTRTFFEARDSGKNGKFPAKKG